jgi:hypothetical protein
MAKRAADSQPGQPREIKKKKASNLTTKEEQPDKKVRETFRPLAHIKY